MRLCGGRVPGNACQETQAFARALHLALELGGVLVAALGALALFSAMAFLGYRKNDALGRTCERVAMWLVVCVGCGTIAAFRLHLVLGFAVAMDLIVAAAFGLQARAQFFGAQFLGAQFLRAIL